MSNLLTVVATTTDGKTVYSGVFSFHETHGLPLNVIFQMFIDNGFMVDWIDFYQSAIGAGMKHDRIISKLEEALNDSFGKQFGDVVISRLNEIFSH